MKKTKKIGWWLAAGALAWTACALALTACVALHNRKGPMPMLKYPASPRGDVVDTLHGVEVADPYRWLEELDSPPTRAWIAAQNELTFDYLGRIPARESIRRRIEKLWDHEKFGVPFKRGGRYFMSHNDGLQNQSVIYVLESLEAKPRVLLDPNLLSADGTVALRNYAVSEDGELLAYGLSDAGSDWMEWKVRRVDDGQDLDDHLKWVKFSGAAWTPDGRGFYYGRYAAPQAGEELKDANYHHKLYYHRLGAPQAEDELVYERPDQKEWGFGATITEDGAYLIVSVWKGSARENAVFYRRLDRPDAPTVELLKDFDARYEFVGNDGATFYFLTDRDAPMSRLIAIDLARPEPAHWRELLSETEAALEDVNLTGDLFFARYLHHACGRVRVFDLQGKPVRDVALPGKGSVGGFHGRRDARETFYYYADFTTPGTVYHHELETGASRVFREPKVDFDPTQFEAKQVFYKSKDGTRVPMFVVHKRGLELDGANPTYLYGYGGFNATMTPFFSVSLLVWMERGGVFAMPNLRGGGEYGKAWHEAGMKLNKQNTFDDFSAAAEWLIASGYTRRDKLAIGGGSNGGLLVGACLTQRPELFGAALPAVGVMDMLRFHKFTIGWAWVSDYGSPENAEEFRALRAYSPLHNIRPGAAYPPTLITTGDHDDRVFPAHSFKFAAALQHAQAGPAPILIRIETRAGHGAGKPTSKIIDEAADRWAFLTAALDME